MNITIETKGGKVVGAADESGATVNFTVNDTSSTPIELVVKAAIEAAHATPTPPAVDNSDQIAAKAAADAVRDAADEAAKKFDDAVATPTEPTTPAEPEAPVDQTTPAEETQPTA